MRTPARFLETYLAALLSCAWQIMLAVRLVRSWQCCLELVSVPLQLIRVETLRSKIINELRILVLLCIVCVAFLN